MRSEGLIINHVIYKVQNVTVQISDFQFDVPVYYSYTNEI